MEETQEKAKRLREIFKRNDDTVLIKQFKSHFFQWSIDLLSKESKIAFEEMRKELIERGYSFEIKIKK